MNGDGVGSLILDPCLRMNFQTAPFTLHFLHLLRLAPFPSGPPLSSFFVGLRNKEQGEEVEGVQEVNGERGRLEIGSQTRIKN